MGEQVFPEPTVGALIFNSEGKVFLVKSHKWKDMYVCPGGHIELGETMEQALKREIKEETGMDITDIKHVCTHEFVHGEEFWKKKHFIFLDFVCKAVTTDVVLNEEGQEYIWIGLDELSKYPIERYTMKAINKYLEMVK